MDFVHDQLATGKKIRVLTVVDTFTRYVPVLDPRFSYRAEDVVRALEQVCPKIGYPKTIRVDQGSEFVPRDLDLWAYAKGVTLDFSRPGKPTDNAYIEAFNGRIRAECFCSRGFGVKLFIDPRPVWGHASVRGRQLLAAGWGSKVRRTALNGGLAIAR